jgi:hypothetical protein
MQITCRSYDTTENTEKYLSGQKFSPKFFFILMNANPTICPNFVEIGGLLFFCPFSTTPPNFYKKFDAYGTVPAVNVPSSKVEKKAFCEKFIQEQIVLL